MFNFIKSNCVKAGNSISPFWRRVIIASSLLVAALLLLWFGIDLWTSLPEFGGEMRDRFFYLSGLDAWGAGCNPAEAVELEKLIELSTHHGRMVWGGLVAVTGAGFLGNLAKKAWKKS